MAGDLLDFAQDSSETYLKGLLKNHRHTHTPFSGFCLYCKDPVPEKRFCDSLCRDLHERSERMKKIEGMPEE